MFTNDMFGMIAGIIFTLVGITCLVLMVMQYRQKGPVMSTAYFAATKEEQETMRTKKAYRYAGNIFLYLGIISTFLGLSFLLDNVQLAWQASVLVMCGVLSSVIYLVTRDK